MHPALHFVSHEPIEELIRVTDELALGSHDSAPSGVACVTRRPVAQEVCSNRGVQAVSAYEEVAALLSAASERCPHVALCLLEADALSAEVHLAPCPRKPLEQRRLACKSARCAATLVAPSFSRCSDTDTLESTSPRHERIS